MTSNDQIRDEKAAEISALLSGKTDKMDILLVKKYYHPINNK